MRVKRKVKFKKDRHKKIFGIVIYTLVLPATSIFLGYLVSILLVIPKLSK